MGYSKEHDIHTFTLTLGRTDLGPSMVDYTKEHDIRTFTATHGDTDLGRFRGPTF